MSFLSCATSCLYNTARENLLVLHAPATEGRNNNRPTAQRCRPPTKAKRYMYTAQNECVAGQETKAGRA